MSPLGLLGEPHLGEAHAELGDHVVQHVAVLPPEGRVLPQIVLQHGVVQPLEQGLHVAGEGGLHVDEAVAGGVGVGGRDGGAAARPAVDLPVGGVAPEVGEDVGEHLLDAHLYVLAASRAGAVSDGGQRREGGVLRRELETWGKRRHRRPGVGVAEAVHQTADGLDYQLAGQVAAVRAAEAERRNGHVHKARIGAAERVVSQAEVVQRESRAVVHQDVRRPGQRGEALSVGLFAEVERDAALVDVEGQKPDAALRAGLVAHVGAQVARGATLGRLDLHHVGAEVGHQPPAVLRARSGEVEHAQVRKGRRLAVPAMCRVWWRHLELPVLSRWLAPAPG